MSATREQILSTASRLFAERGYELVGINEIIEKSGVAKATFYAHFKSKEKLCAEWMRQEAARSEKYHDGLLGDSGTATDRVRRKYESLASYIATSDFRGCPFSITASMLESGTETREVIRDYKASARAFWQSIALEIHREPSRARALGDTLFLLFSGAITEAQNFRNAWPVESAKNAALRLCKGDS